MKASEHGTLYLYRPKEKPVSLITISQERLHEFLAPHLDQALAWADRPHVLAEIKFAGRDLLWFSCQDGAIIMHLDVPLFRIPLLRSVDVLTKQHAAILNSSEQLRLILNSKSRDWDFGVHATTCAI
jgi:hypothetical protein